MCVSNLGGEGYNSDSEPKSSSAPGTPSRSNSSFGNNKSLMPIKKRRLMVPEKPNYSLNLWSIMKNCIGKELTKIPMPVSIFFSFLINKILI